MRGLVDMTFPYWIGTACAAFIAVVFIGAVCLLLLQLLLDHAHD